MLCVAVRAEAECDVVPEGCPIGDEQYECSCKYCARDLGDKIRGCVADINFL